MATFRGLTAYSKAFDLAMEIFEISKAFPTEEKYGLTNQIRRSSRSVCTNIAEGYRKRRYPAHFASKVTDSDMENTETQVWLDFALACDYLTKDSYNQLLTRSDEVGRLINHILENPEKYGSGKVKQ